MERPNLKLVPGNDGAETAPAPYRPGRALVLGAICLACGIAATGLGADRGRRPWRPDEVAREALRVVIHRGPSAPESRSVAIDIRRRLGRNPLDSRTRVLYAALLLELSGDRPQTKAAAFHAERAYSMAPVTVPVVRAVALVLVRCDMRERAVSLARNMFEYEPAGAARLLAQLEPFLPGELTVPDADGGGVPPLPEAWLAWSRELRRQGRSEAADFWLSGASVRWPDHLPTLQAAALHAAAAEDWDALAGILPPDRLLPQQPEAAPLFALRARLMAELGRPNEAKKDAARAETLSNRGTAVLTLVGDALQAAGDADGARRAWKRALYRALESPDGSSKRLGLLIRLARLEEAHGTPSTAKRAWKAVLKESPDHEHARSRFESLSRGRP